LGVINQGFKSVKISRSASYEGSLVPEGIANGGIKIARIHDF